MKKMVLMALTVLGTFVGSFALADELSYSAKSEISANPFVAYGYNPKTKVLSGYLAAFRTMPGRTDECKVVFSGNGDNWSVKYHEDIWVPASQTGKNNDFSIATEKNEIYLHFSKESMGGDCEWILPFKVGPRVRETADKVIVTMKVWQSGDWIGVYVIGAKKANFHSEPNNASVRNAYLIEGNVIYVYDERPDWYFVQHDNGKKKTTGWIRKIDTVQP
jgi:hypothetical protein